MPVSQDHMPMQSCFSFGMNLLEGCDLCQPHQSFFTFEPGSHSNELVLDMLSCPGYSMPHQG